MLAVQRGDLDAGAAAAATAAELARARRDRYALATALEVGALAEPDPATRRRRLEESFTLFDELGCPIDAGRLEVRLAADRLDSFAVTRVAAVAELAQRLGARPLLAQAEEVLGRFASGGGHRLTVTVLGSFAVTFDGQPIPHQAWQSKKARDLFKMLVVLRGRPLPREQAIDRLWPDDDPAKVSNKLSVALATIRSVLDPAKEFPSDHYVRAEGDAVLVDPSTVTADVDRFVSMADAALQELRRSPGSRAASMLAAVESAYTGDVFEDDPYIDWFVPLREEARATYLNITRELASLRVASGDLDDAIRLLLRVLEREPYDESAHLALVAALAGVGRHGDARRRYQHYADRMRELELEPRSFPSAGSSRD
jgi:DNA-binding SARP family transcriptional activator